jgi:6-phosphogluconolactonase
MIRLLLAIGAGVCLLGGLGRAEEWRLFIGTYTTKDNNSQGIYTAKLDTAGQLSPVTAAGTARNPSFLAISPNGKHLYAALENKDGHVQSFAIKPDGTLAEVNQQPTGGAGTAYVGVDAIGAHVLAANYNSGSVASFPLAENGGLREKSSLIVFEGSGPNPKRQKSPHAHSIYAAPGNKIVYACDLGTDHVWIFDFDAASGVLKYASPPSASVPPGSGPRHLAIHSNDKWLYVLNEMGCSVTTFVRDVDTGGLNAQGTLSTLPEGTPAEGNLSAEIFCHPTGRWLYASNRGHNSITVFAIDPASGKLAWIENVPAQVDTPRSFAIDPTGAWIVAAGQKSNSLALLKLDPATGKLTDSTQRAEVPAPVCVTFAK